MSSYLNISVDVEAQPVRSNGDPLKTLIWGQFGGEDYGIGRMMDMADRHGIKLTLYLDYCEFFLYGDALLDVAREIQRRGHDVQMHFHTDLLPAEIGTAQGPSWRHALNSFERQSAKPFATYFTDLAFRATGRQPLAFRGGAFRFNPALLEAFQQVGVVLSSNYHSRAKYWDEERPLVKLFRWPTGTVELPLSGALIGGARKYFIFEDYKVDEERAFSEFVGSFESLPGDLSILCHLIHSWSFLDKDEGGVFVRPSEKKIAKMEAFFAHVAAGSMPVITSEEIIRLTNSANLPIVQYDAVFGGATVPVSAEQSMPAQGERQKTAEVRINSPVKVATRADAMTKTPPPGRAIDADAGRASPRWKSAAIAWLEGRSGSGNGERDSIFAQARDLLKSGYISGELKDSFPAGTGAGLGSLLDGRIHATQSGKVTLPIASFDWRSPGVEDRSSLWVVQQWLFIRDCAYERATRDALEGIRIVTPLVRSWMETNLTEQSIAANEYLSWHDHTTALRAINFIFLAAMLVESGASIEEELPLSSEFVHLHLVILMEESFYQKGTNHGFDQAFALYLLSRSFDLGELTERGIALGRARLEHEIKIAFNDEGVHIENSPNYHVIMIARLMQARGLLCHFDDLGDDLDIESTLTKALEFLAYAVRPDGRVPMLGDSDRSLVYLDLREVEEVETARFLRYALTAGKDGEEPPQPVRLYPKAGYAFLRDRWGGPDDFADVVHLAFKCGFLSTYHRHDDDNSFLLFAFDEDWLIDSGIFKYHENDPHRIYLRSAQAHNTVSIVGVEGSRRLVRSAEGVGIQRWKIAGTDATITSISRMYEGFEFERTLEFDRRRREITVSDRIAPRGSGTEIYETRFHFPADKELEILSRRSVVVRGAKNNCELRIEVAEGEITGVDVATGRLEPTISGWTSPSSGTLESAQTLIFRSESNSGLKTIIRMSFHLDTEWPLVMPSEPLSREEADETPGEPGPAAAEGETELSETTPTQRFGNELAELTIEQAGFGQLPARAHFLEHPFDIHTRSATRTVIAAHYHSVFESNDLGRSWNEFDLSEVIGNLIVKRCFTMNSGERLIQATGDGSGLEEAATFLVDDRWNLIKRCEVGQFHWHGTWSIDQSRTGVVMFSEYHANTPELSVWRTRDWGRNWVRVLTCKSGEVNGAEIRHFHTCLADPFEPGRWLASSGDSPECCRIWLSEDDGNSWVEVGDPVFSDDGRSELTSPRRAYRFTALGFRDDVIFWPTDDNLGRDRSALISADRATPNQVKILGEFGANEMRSLVRVGDGLSVAISESKLEPSVAEAYLIDAELRPSLLARIPNKFGDITAFTKSLCSKAAYDGVFFSYDDGGVTSKDCRFAKWTVSLKRPARDAAHKPRNQTDTPKVAQLQSVQCPICGADSATFVDFFGRPGVRCASCGSLERHRVLKDVYDNFIRSEFNFDDRDIVIFSPNPSELTWLKLKSRVSTVDVRTDVHATFVADVCAMPEIADRSFDLALANHLFPHVYDDDKAFSEIRRILKPGGRLLFTVPLNASRRTEPIKSIDEITRLWGKEAYEKWRIGTYRRYGIIDLLALLQKHFLAQTYYGMDKATGRLEVIFSAEKIDPSR